MLTGCTLPTVLHSTAHGKCWSWRIAARLCFTHRYMQTCAAKRGTDRLQWSQCGHWVVQTCALSKNRDEISIKEIGHLNLCCFYTCTEEKWIDDGPTVGKMKLSLYKLRLNALNTDTAMGKIQNNGTKIHAQPFFVTNILTKMIGWNQTENKTKCKPVADVLFWMQVSNSKIF